MKVANDKKTREICEMDLAGPVPAKPTARDLAKARAARFKERHGVQAITVHLPVAVAADFEAHCVAKGKSKSDVIAHLIKTQLLRKR